MDCDSQCNIRPTCGEYGLDGERPVQDCGEKDYESIRPYNSIGDLVHSLVVRIGNYIEVRCRFDQPNVGDLHKAHSAEAEALCRRSQQRTSESSRVRSSAVRCSPIDR